MELEESGPLTSDCTVKLPSSQQCGAGTKTETQNRTGSPAGSHTTAVSQLPTEEGRVHSGEVLFSK